MTSFGWKRKVGEKVSHEKSSAFEQEARDEDKDTALENGEIDWLTLAPSRKIICLEDAVAKSQRLKEEGTVLADQERFWEALKKWDGALDLNPSDATLHEMKAQAYMQLSEVYPALQAATRAVTVNPTWWVAWQTLGRAHLGLGEVRTALRSFCKAAHLHPADQELWDEDVGWAQSLLQRKRKMEEEKRLAEQAKLAGKVRELDEDGESSQMLPYESRDSSASDTNLDPEPVPDKTDTSNSLTSGAYILMRDCIT